MPDEKTEQEIEELVETRCLGKPVGICGREWCEYCGQLGSFTGFVGAMAAHTSHGRFVCSRCRLGRLNNGRGFTRTDLLDAAILERGFRLCQGCGAEVRLKPRLTCEARRSRVFCGDCSEEDYGLRARRRYLEHEAEMGRLDEARARITWARRGLEERWGRDDAEE
jgi:hypothetical protein